MPRQARIEILHTGVIRYIELNAVRAAMVEPPKIYRWSSVEHHLGLRQDALVTPHPLYIAMAHTPAAPFDAYRHSLLSTMDEDETGRIRAHLAQEKVLGNPRFQALLKKTFNRSVILKPRSRPADQKGDAGNQTHLNASVPFFADTLSAS